MDPISGNGYDAKRKKKVGWPKQYGAKSFRIQFQNKLPTRLIEGDEILSAINFKTARLHFIGDVFVAVVVAYAP